MILDNKNLVEFGYSFNTCRTKDNVYYTCDYCNQEFLKPKSSIIRSRKNIKKDCCNNKNCMLQKRKESNIVLFGADNIFKTKEFKEDLIKNNLKKYGVKTASQSEEVKSKIQKTCQERYGHKSYLASKECRKKMTEKCLFLYKKKNFSQVEKIKEDIKRTCQERYGHESYLSTDEFKRKSSHTCLKKYGVKIASQSEEVKSKMQKTCQEKYKANSPLGNQKIREKGFNTMINKYGTIVYPRTKEYLEKKKKTCLEKYGVEDFMQLASMKEKVFNTKIEKYGKINNFGKTEKEIQTWLATLGLDFKPNFEILGGKEIDLFNQDLKIGIEYCGLFWHTENSLEPRNKKYHYNKYAICKEKGIRLITIFQDEWLKNSDICKNIISSIIGINENILYARKCIVNNLEKNEAKDFLEENHLLGYSYNIKHNFGLYFNKKLVGVISFAPHHRKNDKKEIVLSRLCFLKNYKIIGGASKLFSYSLNYLKDYNKIISWSDNRWFEGKVYEKLGFKLEKIMKPDYSYVNLKSNTRKRHSKQSFKSKLIPDGFSKIWDCGKKRWIYMINL